MNMYIYIHIHIYIYIHVCIYKVVLGLGIPWHLVAASIYANIYIFLHTLTYILTHIYVHTYVYMYIYTCIYVYTAQKLPGNQRLSKLFDWSNKNWWSFVCRCQKSPCGIIPFNWKLMVQIRQKTGTGFEKHPPWSFWCGIYIYAYIYIYIYI